MLNWLFHTLPRIIAGIPSAVVNFINTVVGGVAGLLDIIFGHVGRAWDDLATAVGDFAADVRTYVSSVWNELDKIITYYIPHFAMTAWWWVTHPDALAQLLFWYVIKWLEYYAWTAAKYLGEFILALIVRNLRRILLLAETIVTAIL